MKWKDHFERSIASGANNWLHRFRRPPAGSILRRKQLGKRLGQINREFFIIQKNVQYNVLEKVCFHLQYSIFPSPALSYFFNTYQGI